MTHMPRLVGKYVRFADVDDHIEGLWRLEMTGENAIRYRANGYTVPLARYQAELHSPMVAVQFALVSNATDELVGHVVATSLDTRHGHCHISIVLDPAFTPWTWEGVAMFIDWLFAVFPLRKIYAQAAEYNAEQFLGGLGHERFKDLLIEHRKGQHFWHDSKFWDLIEWELWRETWAVSNFADGRYLTPKEQTA